jgi:serine/threonine protein kinase
MPDLTGKILANRYKVVSNLGRGGMAEVYKVYDMQRATHLAIKVLHEDLAEDMVFLRRFQREAHTLANLQHPNIVRFYGLDMDGHTAFILMDLVEGSTLRREINQRQQPASSADILRIMRPVCAALHYAHQVGIVHCDIKPANIMLQTNGAVLIADFGIARVTETATTTTFSTAGTPAYMAPEQIRGLPPTPQTDLYGLGIVLFEMLTGGQRPFTGDHAQTVGSTNEKVRWEHLYLPPVSPRTYNPAITPALENVVQRCLQKDPAYRFSSALELLNALEQALLVPAGYAFPPAPAPTNFPQPVPVISPPQLPHTVRQKPPSVWIWAGLAGFVVIVFGILAVSPPPSGLPLATVPPYNPRTPTIYQSPTQVPANTTAPGPRSTATPIVPANTRTSAITPTPAEYKPLDNCAVSRLRVGDRAMISLTEGRNSIRTTPDTHPTNNTIGYAEPGELVDIIDGPVCNYGWVLWKVHTQKDLTGWTPEGDGKVYWLIPVSK